MAVDAGDTARVLPGLTQLNRDFWQGGAVGELRIYRCGSCATYAHPPMPACAACGASDMVPTVVSGRGTVASFSINHQPWLPAMVVPFVFAAVELVEQRDLYVLTNIVGCAPDAVRIGLEVCVAFEAHEDVHLPMFRPASR